MTSAQRKAKSAPERAGEMKLISATRSALKLEAGEYPFEGCIIGQWDIPETKVDDTIRPAVKIDYLAIDTEHGMRGIPSGSLFNCYLTDEGGETVGKVIGDLVNPITDLTGVLIITKNGTQVELELQGVSASQLAA